MVLELLDMVDAWFAQRVLVWAQMTGPGMGIQHWFQVGSKTRRCLDELKSA